MGFFNLIAELRTGTPDINKAVKAMNILGWLCLLNAVWNFIFYYLDTSFKNLFNLPPSLIYTVVIGLAFVALLFFQAARGIRQIEPWGRRTGQVAVALFAVLFIGFMFSVFRSWPFPGGDGPFLIFFLVFIIIFMAQFAVPAFYGIRYLGRLPVSDGSYAAYRVLAGGTSDPLVGKGTVSTPMPQTKYNDSPSPFGIYGTFFLLLAVPLLLVFISLTFRGEEFAPLIILPFLLFIFLGPIIYNFFSSPFEKERTLIASFTGSGSISVFSGSWPFFRLMVYEDAVEMRIMFQRYLIPYDRMENLPEKVGFFTTSILFQSDLPGVPSQIKYSGFGMKKTLEVLNMARNQYLAGHSPIPNQQT